MDIKQVTAEVIQMAHDFRHLANMRSSADLCLEDARRLHALGDHRYAAGRALRSLEYSVGVFGYAYQHAKSLIERAN